MPNNIVRLTVLALAVSTAACNGGGGSLPFAGPPNSAGGTAGTFQSGGTTTGLLRFVQGSPDSGTVDVCVDDQPYGLTNSAVPYGTVAPLFAVAGGISHSISAYPTLGPAQAGLECATAPGPYLGTNTIAVTVIAPGTAGNPQRETIVLGGTVASGKRGFYVFGDPSFATAPTSQAISHNAAPAFSTGKANGIGFGTCSTTVTPCVTAVALAGAQGVAAPVISTSTALAAINSQVQSTLAGVPAGFYDGIGVAAGNPVPITSIGAPGAIGGQPYVVQLYAIDGPAGGLNLASVVETTVGFGF